MGLPSIVTRQVRKTKRVSPTQGKVRRRSGTVCGSQLTIWVSALDRELLTALSTKYKVTRSNILSEALQQWAERKSGRPVERVGSVAIAAAGGGSVETDLLEGL